MRHPLEGIDRKLQRAIAHINDLDQQIRNFQRGRPYSVRVESDVQDAQPVWRVIAVDNGAAAPDVSLVLLAGEALYQLHSALDHLIHHLVIVSGAAEKLEA